MLSTDETRVVSKMTVQDGTIATRRNLPRLWERTRSLAAELVKQVLVKDDAGDLDGAKGIIRAELGTNWRAIVRDYRNYRAEYAHALNERQGEAHHTPWHAQQTAVAAAGTDATAAKSAMTVGAKVLAM